MLASSPMTTSPFAQLTALLGRVHLNPWRSAPRGIPRQTLDDVLVIFVERTAVKEGEAAAPAKNAEADGRRHHADGRRHHALAALVMDEAL